MLLTTAEQCCQQNGGQCLPSTLLLRTTGHDGRHQERNNGLKRALLLSTTLANLFFNNFRDNWIKALTNCFTNSCHKILLHAIPPKNEEIRYIMVKCTTQTNY